MLHKIPEYIKYLGVEKNIASEILKAEDADGASILHKLVQGRQDLDGVENFRNLTRQYFNFIGKSNIDENSKEFANVFDVISKGFKDIPKDSENAYDEVKVAFEGMSKKGFQFSDTLKEIGKSMAIMFAINMGIKAVAWLWDTINVTLEEQQQIVDELSDSISTLKKEEEELLKLQKQDGLTEAEQARLDYLQARLQLEEKLFRVEQKKLAESELFGKGDINASGIVGNGRFDGEAANTAENYYSTLAQIENQQQKLQTVLQVVEDATNNGNAFLAEIYMGQANKIRDNLDGLHSDLLQYQSEYLSYAETIRSYLDAGVWDDDIQTKQQMETLYQSYLKTAEDIESEVIQIDAELNIIDRGSIERKIKGHLGGLFGEDYDQAFVDSLTNEDLRAVELGIDNGTIKTWGDLEKAVEDVQNAEKELEKQHKKTTYGYLTGIQGIAEDLSKLKAIYADVKDGGEFDFSSLIDSDFNDKFGEFTEEYDEFIRVVSSSPTDIKKCQDAFNNLATAYVNDADELQNLTEENKAATTAMLKQSGVANAAEVVNWKLAQSYVEQGSQAIYAGSETDTYIQKIENLGMSSEFTESALWQLQAAEIAANSQKLDFTEQIEACNKLAIAAGQASAMLTVAQSQRSILQQLQAEGISYEDALASGKLADLQNELIANQVTHLQNRIASEVKSSIVQTHIGDTSSSDGSDAYTAEIDSLYLYKKALEDVQAAREKIDKAYDNTDDAETRIYLMEQRIALLNEEQEKTQELNDARDKLIQANVDKLVAKGFDVVYDPTADNLLIRNKEHLNNLSQSIIEEYEELINSTESLNDENRDLANSWLDNYYALRDYKKELEELRQEQWRTEVSTKEFLADSFSDIKGKETDVINIYQDVIDVTTAKLKEAFEAGGTYADEWVQELINKLQDAGNQIKDLNIQIWQEEADKNDDALAGVNAIINEQIELLEKEKEELEAINDENADALKKAQLMEALEKSRNQKTRQVYRKGLGWIWEADPDAEKQATADLQEYENEQQIKRIDDEIKAWQEYLELWNNIPDDYEDAQNKLIAAQQLGSDIQEQILNRNKDIIDDYADHYIDTMDKLKEYEAKNIEDLLKEFMGSDYQIYEDILKGKQVSRTWYATLNGTAPSGAKIGDKILTSDGTYQIVEDGTKGAKQSSVTGLWSKKIDDIKTDINESNAGTIRNTEVIEYATSKVSTATNSIYDNSTSTDVNTKAIDEQTEVLEDLPSQIADETSDAIQAGIENSGIIEALGDYVIGADGGSGLKDDEIIINQESMLKGLEQLKNTVGENSDTYKAALDHYNSLYGEKGTTFYGINAQSPGYSSGKTFANFEEFFASFNATNKGNGFWEYIDEHGHTTAKTYDSFINDYVLNRPSGYTDRERALSTINKAIETGYIEDLKEYYGNYYTRLLDIINTPEGGDRALTTAVREDTERAIREILNSKNNPDKVVGGSYDSTGKKVISISVNKDDEIVDIGYSKLAADLSAYVDNLSEMPSGEDIYNSDIYKQIYGYSIDPNNKYYYDPSRDGNVDQVRAYDSSYNKEFESLKISTNKNAEETRTNSEILKDNAAAIEDLNTTFGEGMYDLKDSVDGVVEVIDKLGNTVGTINTTIGSLHQSGGNNTSSNRRPGSGNSFSLSIGNGLDSYDENGNGNVSADVPVIGSSDETWNSYYSSKGASATASVSIPTGSTTDYNSLSDERKAEVSLKIMGYAKGTKRAPRGIANVDELGEELIIRNPDQGRYTYLEKGDAVIPVAETNRFFNFLSNPEAFVDKLVNGINITPTVSDVMGVQQQAVVKAGTVNNGDNITEYHFEKLEVVCPNVTDGNSLIQTLQHLDVDALQFVNKR